MSTRSLVPRANNEGGLGTIAKRWAQAFINVVTAKTIILEDGEGSYFQLPKLSEIQRDQLTAVNGMVIYNVTVKKIQAYEDGVWVDIYNAPADLPSSTTDLPEGSQLYFTPERVDDRVSQLLQAGSGITISYNDTNNTLQLSASGVGVGIKDVVPLTIALG